MKKTIVYISLLASTALFAIDCSKLAQEFQSTKFAKENDIKILQAKKVTDHICQNKFSINGKLIKNYMFLTDENKNILIEGNLFDISKKKVVTLNDSILKYKDNAAFVIGNGQDEYYLFTDPDCPFCKIFANIVEKGKDRLKVHVFLYPQKSLHPDSEKKSYYIASLPKEKRYDAYLKMEKNISFNEKSITNEGKRLVEKNKLIGEKVGVEGTPYILDSKGNRVDYAVIAQKYKIKPDIFPEILHDIKKSKLAIVFGDQNKDEVFFFVKINSFGDKLIDQIEKLSKKYKVYVIPFIDTSDKNKFKERVLIFHYIYYDNDPKKKKERFLSINKKGKIEGDIRKYIKQTPSELKAEQFISQVTQMFAIFDNTLYDANGKVIEMQAN